MSVPYEKPYVAFIVCVRACVRACVCARVFVRMCVCVPQAETPLLGTGLGMKEACNILVKGIDIAV